AAAAPRSVDGPLSVRPELRVRPGPGARGSRRPERSWAAEAWTQAPPPRGPYRRPRAARGDFAATSCPIMVAAPSPEPVHEGYDCCRRKSHENHPTILSDGRRGGRSRTRASPGAHGGRSTGPHQEERGRALALRDG